MSEKIRHTLPNLNKCASPPPRIPELLPCRLDLQENPRYIRGLYLKRTDMVINKGESNEYITNEPGLYCSEDIDAATFIAFYHGDIRQVLPKSKLTQSDHSVTFQIEGKRVEIVSPIDPYLNVVDLQKYPAAAANEPRDEETANAFVDCGRLEVEGKEHEQMYAALFSNDVIFANTEIVWNYGKDYDEIRERMGYIAGEKKDLDVYETDTLPARAKAIFEEEANGTPQDCFFPYEQLPSRSDLKDSEWQPQFRTGAQLSRPPSTRGNGKKVDYVDL